MLDLMRELRFPVILVVANRLGCLNHAVLSLDALEQAGLTAAGMMLCRTTPPARADAGTSEEAEALILGDNVEVGCGTVLNPGTIVGRNTNIYPLSMVRGYVPEGSIYKNAGEVARKR